MMIYPLSPPLQPALQAALQAGFDLGKSAWRLGIKALHPRLLWGLMVVVSVGCEGGDEGVDERVHEVQGQCAEGVPGLTISVEPHVSAIGPLGNALGVGDGAIFIVESGANTVSRYAPGVGMASGFVDVGNDRNPYNLFVDDEGAEIFVVNYLAHTLSVARLATGEIVEEMHHESLRSPSDVVATKTHVFVANVNYLSLAEGYGPGSISVFERDGLRFVGEVETAFKNPQFLELVEQGEESRLLVSAAGELRFGASGVEVASEGGLEVWRWTDNPVESERDVHGLGQDATPRIGGPGRPALTPDKRYVYLTSAVAPVLFKFDLDEARWVFDSAHPFVLYDTAQDATHSAILDDRGLLYVTAFNDDALYLVDTACDAVLAGPVDLGRRTDLLEGPQSLALLEADDGIDLYFIMSIANGLGRVKIRP